MKAPQHVLLTAKYMPIEQNIHLPNIEETQKIKTLETNTQKIKTLETKHKRWSQSSIQKHRPRFMETKPQQHVEIIS